MSASLRSVVSAMVVIVGAGTAIGEEARIRIVVFSPKDVAPPKNIPQRMKQVVDYAQSFYGQWLQHWGYEPENVLPVDRDAKGVPVVYFVRGTETAASGKYDREEFQGEVRERAISQYRIPRSGSTWWIFVYGTKLKASRGWGGHADVKGNGLTLLVWNDVPGALSNDDPLAGGTADRLNLKGYLHELGHTMSLPHIGPSPRHGLGMSLMGPNARTYRKALSNKEERVYMTPAVAALIWKQPQMTGKYEPKPKLPQIAVKDLRTEYERTEKRFVLTGRLEANLPAHSIVAIDIPEKGLDDYRKRGYSSRLEKDGSFKLFVDELVPSSGTLKVVFCFDNGVFTGNGKGVGFRQAVSIPYRYENSTYQAGS